MQHALTFELPALTVIACPTCKPVSVLYSMLIAGIKKPVTAIKPAIKGMYNFLSIFKFPSPPTVQN